MKKDYPKNWTDLIGEIFCGIKWMSQKKWQTVTYPEGKPLEVITNKDYVPKIKRSKRCTKELGLNCIGCPFLLISDATPEMMKHIEKFYKKKMKK